MEKKTGKALILLLNAAGLACLVYFAVLFLSHDTRVMYPEAMLPMQNWERGGWSLTLGVVPLAAANALAYAFLGREKSKWLRLCFFIPTAVCLTIAIIYLLHNLY